VVLDEPVELIDVTPTVLGLIGVRAGAAFQGRDLSAAVLGRESLDPSRAIFLHRRHYEPGVVERTAVSGQKLGIRQGDWKLIVGDEEGTRELFNLKSDPWEDRNLHAMFSGKASELENKLESWRRSVSEKGLTHRELSAEDRAALEALGYTA
jgi:arylsulfatase A-like enzyme